MQAMARIHHQAAMGVFRRQPDALELALDRLGVLGLGVGPGVQLDGRRAGPDRGVDLRRLRVDEQ